MSYLCRTRRKVLERPPNSVLLLSLFDFFRDFHDGRNRMRESRSRKEGTKEGEGKRLSVSM